MHRALGSPKQYRDFAAQCRDWAIRTTDGKHESMMLQLAQHWMRMAEELERSRTPGDATAALLAEADVWGGAPVRANFSSEEWALLLESVAMAGLVVMAADPGRLWHLIKESCAAVDAGVQVRMNPASNPLVLAVTADFGTARGRGIACDGLREKLAGLGPSEIRSKCIETLGRAGAVIDARAPADAAAFKCWLHHISERVAEAAGAGMFPGAHRAPASETEILAEISRALRLKRAATP